MTTGCLVSDSHHRQFHLPRMLLALLLLISLQQHRAEADQFAFLVGVGDYGRPKLNLQNTVPEINQLAAVLKSQTTPQGSKYYKEVMTITDETTGLPPTRENIIVYLRKLRDLLKRNNPTGALNHSVLIVLNGHGVELEKEGHQFTFCPKDATAESRRTRLSLEEIVNELCFDEEDGVRQAIPHELLFVVNACRNDAAPGMNFGSQGAKNLPVSLKVSKSAVLYACSSGEQSLINKHSVEPRSFFMTEMIAGWMGAADGEVNDRRDGMVSLFELETYLLKKVPEQVTKITEDKETQTPILMTANQKLNWMLNPSIPKSVPDPLTIVGSLPPHFYRERNWSKHTFVDVTFPRVSLSDYNLSQASFVRCTFNETRFTDKTNLGKASFVGCTFNKLDLSDARNTKYMRNAGGNNGVETIIWDASRQAPDLFDLGTGISRQ